VTSVLFLCTGNSARSILAEAILARRGGGRFTAFSAGSHPRGEVHPLALALLEEEGHDVATLRSKSWDEFAAAGARAIERIVTVCDNAAGEACPIWPGKPAISHWSLPDPAAVEGSDSERRAAFRRIYDELDARISRLVAET
jgi:protein-tyrosine-phosphatase